MGGGTSKQYLTGSPIKRRRSSAKIFVEPTEQPLTSIEMELSRPLDGSDVTTPRSTKLELQRLRKIIFSESRRNIHAHQNKANSHEEKMAASNSLMYGQVTTGHIKSSASSSTKTTETTDSTVTTSEPLEQAMTVTEPAVEQSCQHIDIFDDRRKKKRQQKSKLRKNKFKNTAKHILKMLEVTHQLFGIINDSVKKVDGVVNDVALHDDPSIHVQSLIHSDYHDREVAVLVSDLSGFTSTTRKYGIVHFASIIVRMRQLVLPIFTKYQALNITTEADNFITIFPDSISAVSAALEMQQILLKYNASLPENRQHYKVRLNGIGVGCGIGVLLDKEGKLHGEPSNEAYHIGEDICEGGMVLLTQKTAEKIQVEGSRLVAQDAITIEDFPYQPEGETEEQVVYQKISVNALPMEAELVPTTDMRYLSPSLQLFAQRHDPAANVEELDREIADKFKSNFTALMYSLDLETGAHLYGATQSIVLKSISLSIIRPIFLKYHAIELEDELFIFYEPADAVNAALDAKDAVQHYNQQLTSEHEKNRLNVVGWGIHVGTMIFVEGTDIHWGDPVNTASKLGQDLATDGDLLLSSAVMAIAKEHHKLCETGSKKVIFEERKLKRSGVDFLAYCASRVGDEGESAV